MPNSKSAEKRVKVNASKRMRNVRDRSSLKTAVKRFDQALNQDQEAAPAKLNNAIKALDKAASKGIIHKNAAARRKSRLTKKMNRVAAN